MVRSNVPRFETLKKKKKKDGLSVRNTGKLQVAFLFAVLLLNVYIFVPSFSVERCRYSGARG